MQSDLEAASELEQLRAQVREMHTVLLVLLVRDGRIRISPSEIASLDGKGLSIAVRKDGAGAVVLELQQSRPTRAPAQAQQQPASPIVVPQLRAH